LYEELLGELIAGGVIRRDDSVLVQFAGEFDRAVAERLGLTGCTFVNLAPDSPSSRLSDAVQGDAHRMDLDDEVWHIVKNTSKITGFVSSGQRPTPIADDEVKRMLGQGQDQNPKPVVQFEEGEDVRVIHGPFSNLSGTVAEVKPEREQVHVMVAVFGRATPVWLSYEHVEKV